MHRLAIATGRKRRRTPPSGDENSLDEDSDDFTEEQKGQLEFAEEAGDRPPPLRDGKADRWAGMHFAAMSPLQRKVYLDNIVVVLASGVVDVVDAAEGVQEGGDRWQEVARMMGMQLQAIDKATGLPEDTILERQEQLVHLLNGLGSGEEFNSRAKLARLAISTLAKDLLTARFQQENKANPPAPWEFKARGKKNRTSTSSSGSKRDFGDMLGDLQPQVEEGLKQQETFQQMMIEQGRQTLAWQQDQKAWLQDQKERADETLAVLRALKEGSDKQTEVLAALAAVLARQSTGK